MKPQDIVLIIILTFLTWKKNPKYFLLSGLSLYSLAIPLFYFQIFFTAERLIWYGFLFLLISVIIFIVDETKG
jgi:hypothetical protein